MSLDIDYRIGYNSGLNTAIDEISQQILSLYNKDLPKYKQRKLDHIRKNCISADIKTLFDLIDKLDNSKRSIWGDDAEYDTDYEPSEGDGETEQEL